MTKFEVLAPDDQFRPCACGVQRTEFLLPESMTYFCAACFDRYAKLNPMAPLCAWCNCKPGDTPVCTEVDPDTGMCAEEILICGPCLDMADTDCERLDQEPVEVGSWLDGPYTMTAYGLAEVLDV